VYGSTKHTSQRYASCSVGRGPRGRAHARFVDSAATASPPDLRDRIALLEREGEFVRISADVDLHLEITEIVDRAG